MLQLLVYAGESFWIKLLWPPHKKVSSHWLDISLATVLAAHPILLGKQEGSWRLTPGQFLGKCASVALFHSNLLESLRDYDASD